MASSLSLTCKIQITLRLCDYNDVTQLTGEREFDDEDISEGAGVFPGYIWTISVEYSHEYN